MKKLLYLLFGLLVLAGCGKDKDPKPKSPADAVAGQYTMTAFRLRDTSENPDLNIDIPKMPFTNNGVTISGTVVLTTVATTQDQVSLKMSLKVTGQQDGVIDIPEVKVTQSGQSYVLAVDGDQVGTVNGNELVFDVTETNPATNDVFELGFTAKK